MRGRALVVDIRHWLEEDGSIPDKSPRFRHQVLRIARLIESGGPLAVSESRETLVECGRRPARKECQGLMWVAKADAANIHAYCIVCGGNEVFISGWEETEWADGMMEPVSPSDLDSRKVLQ